MLSIKVPLAIALSLLPTLCAGAGSALAETPVTAQEAGARFGEALGAIEICDGTSLSDKATTLKASFSGADIERFTSQATKVYGAWLTVKHCVRPNDPNPCRIIIQKSCLAAISERI